MAAAAAAAASPHGLHDGPRRAALASRPSVRAGHEPDPTDGLASGWIRVPPHLEGYLTVGQSRMDSEPSGSSISSALRARARGTTVEWTRERRRSTSMRTKSSSGAKSAAGRGVDRMSASEDRSPRGFDSRTRRSKVGDLLSGKSAPRRTEADVGRRRPAHSRAAARAISDAANQVARVVTAVAREHPHAASGSTFALTDREPVRRGSTPVRGLGRV